MKKKHGLFLNQIQRNRSHSVIKNLYEYRKQNPYFYNNTSKATVMDNCSSTEKFVIEAVHPFGRTPVIATLNGKSWSTSLWTEKSGVTMIAVPKKVRGKFKAGDEVEISFVFDYDRF